MNMNTVDLVTNGINLDKPLPFDVTEFLVLDDTTVHVIAAPDPSHYGLWHIGPTGTWGRLAGAAATNYAARVDRITRGDSDDPVTVHHTHPLHPLFFTEQPRADTHE